MTPKPDCKCGRKHFSRGVCQRCYEQLPDRKAKRREKSLRIYHTVLKHDPTHVEKVRADGRFRRTGFTPELLSKVRACQKDKCAICTLDLVLDYQGAGCPAPTGCCDHDHATHKPRGLLCRSCNLALGLYETRQRPQGLVIDAYENYLLNPPVVLCP